MGAAAGLTIAALGLLEGPSPLDALPDDVAARVGDRTIRMIDYHRVLAGVENDLRNPLDDEMRRRVLDRMIDEELLVQRALELGLASVDRRVRGELTSGLIDSIVAEADAVELSEAAIARHYEENIDFFSRPARLRAQTMFFSGNRSAPSDSKRSAETIAAAERASRARARLLRSEEPVDRIALELADVQVSPVPDTLLPANKIRDYVGPAVVEALEDLELGVWSAPIEVGNSAYLARVVAREPPIVPALDEVRDLVRQDLKRREGDKALRRYLDELRHDKPVAIHPELSG